MKKIINNLRNQPEQVRRHILHVATIIFGVILLSLWIWSLGTSLNNPETQAKASEELKPFSEIKENLIGGYKNISESDQNTEE